MVGGLLVSQALTLFTTPVIYLAFDKLSRRLRQRFGLPETQGHRGDDEGPEGTPVTEDGKPS